MTIDKKRNRKERKKKETVANEARLVADLRGATVSGEVVTIPNERQPACGYDVGDMASADYENSDRCRQKGRDSQHS